MSNMLRGLLKPRNWRLGGSAEPAENDPSPAGRAGAAVTGDNHVVDGDGQSPAVVQWRTRGGPAWRRSGGTCRGNSQNSRDTATSTLPACCVPPSREDNLRATNTATLMNSTSGVTAPSIIITGADTVGTEDNLQFCGNAVLEPISSDDDDRFKDVFPCTGNEDITQELHHPECIDTGPVGKRQEGERTSGGFDSALAPTAASLLLQTTSTCDGDEAEEMRNTHSNHNVSRRPGGSLHNERSFVTMSKNVAEWEKAGTGYFETCAVIVKSFVGGAFLFLPYAVLKAGVIVSAVTLIAVFLLALYCMVLLVRCCDASEKDAVAAKLLQGKECGSTPKSVSSPQSNNSTEMGSSSKQGFLCKADSTRTKEFSGNEKGGEESYEPRRWLFKTRQLFAASCHVHRRSSGCHGGSTHSWDTTTRHSTEAEHEDDNEGSPTIKSLSPVVSPTYHRPAKDSSGGTAAEPAALHELQQHKLSSRQQSQVSGVMEKGDCSLRLPNHLSGESLPSTETRSINGAEARVTEDVDAIVEDKNQKKQQQQQANGENSPEEDTCDKVVLAVPLGDGEEKGGGVAAADWEAAAVEGRAATVEGRAATVEGRAAVVEGSAALEIEEIGGISDRIGGEEGKRDSSFSSSLAAEIVASVVTRVDEVTACVGKETTSSRALLCTYESVAREACGLWGERVVEACVVLSQLSFATVNTVLVAGNVRDVVWTAAGCNPAFNWPIRAIMWTTALLYIPLCLIRRMKHVVPLALMANVGTAIGLMVLIIFVCVEVFDGKRAYRPIHVPLASWENWPVMLGTSVYLWEGAGLVLPIRQEAKPKVQKHYASFFSASLGFLLLFYIAYALLCCFAFGERLQMIILFNLSSGPVSLIVQMVLAIAILATYPLLMLPALNVVEQHLVACARVQRLSGHKRMLVTNGSRCLLALATLGAATLGVRHLDDFVALIGGLCGAPLVFVFPVIFHMRLVKQGHYLRLFHFCIIVVGFAIQIFCVISSIISWKGDSEFDARCLHRQLRP